MLSHPLLLAFFLFLIVATVIFISEHKQTSRFFKYIPAVFWIYFLPMLATMSGAVDTTSPFLSFVPTFVLPVSLFILLLAVDLKAIARLGAPALLTMLGGSGAMMIGAVVAFAIVSPIVGVEFWKGFGALCGSWTGGSANMIAVKEALNTPDNVFAPMVVVDTFVPYFWMAVLILLKNKQGAIDRFNRVDNNGRDVAMQRLYHCDNVVVAGNNTMHDLCVIAIAVGIAFGCMTLGGVFAKTMPFFGKQAWTIILVTTCALGASLTPLRTLLSKRVNNVGQWLLFYVLAAIGAKAQLDIGKTLPLLMGGFVILTVHACALFAMAYVFRIPFFLCAIASQANIGGVASTPVVAEIYRPGLAPLGLLLAIFGNIVGTYIGITAGYLCLWVTNV